MLAKPLGRVHNPVWTIHKITLSNITFSERPTSWCCTVHEISINVRPVTYWSLHNVFRFASGATSFCSSNRQPGSECGFRSGISIRLFSPLNSVYANQPVSFTFKALTSISAICLWWFAWNWFHTVFALIIKHCTCVFLCLLHLSHLQTCPNQTLCLYFSYRRNFSFLANPLETLVNSHSPVGSLAEQLNWRSVSPSGSHVLLF